MANIDAPWDEDELEQEDELENEDEELEKELEHEEELELNELELNELELLDAIRGRPQNSILVSSISSPN